MLYRKQIIKKVKLILNMFNYCIINAKILLAYEEKKRIFLNRFFFKNPNLVGTYDPHFLVLFNLIKFDK